MGRWHLQRVDGLHEDQPEGLCKLLCRSVHALATLRRCVGRWPASPAYSAEQLGPAGEVEQHAVRGMPQLPVARRGTALHRRGRCPACKTGKPERAQRRIFCASLSDVFDNEVDPSWREDLFALIESTPNLDWLLLTKRIGLVHKMVPASWMENGFPKHVWLGATIVDQTEADRDIPKLLALPASVRFLSMEPLMGPVNFRWMPYAHQAAGEDYRTYMERRGGVNHLESLRGIHWVIAGGESGHQARPMHPQWVRSLRDQCREAGVAFLFKQWGEWISKDAAGVALDLCYEKSRIGGWVERDGSFTAGEAAAPKDLATAAHVFRIGKSLAGSMLDGSEHLQFPRSVL